MERELYGIYRVCLALVVITEKECCCYGFEPEIEVAEQYIEAYEKDHPELFEEDTYEESPT